VARRGEKRILDARGEAFCRYANMQRLETAGLETSLPIFFGVTRESGWRRAGRSVEVWRMADFGNDLVSGDVFEIG